MIKQFDVRALADAVQHEVRHLMRMHTSTMHRMPMLQSTEQARSLLRIEASPEVIWLAMRDINLNSFPKQSGEPLLFMGVSLYEVRHALPPEGWKIINPFRP